MTTRFSLLKQRLLATYIVRSEGYKGLSTQAGVDEQFLMELKLFMATSPDVSGMEKFQRDLFGKYPEKGEIYSLWMEFLIKDQKLVTMVLKAMSSSQFADIYIDFILEGSHPRKLQEMKSKLLDSYGPEMTHGIFILSLRKMNTLKRTTVLLDVGEHLKFLAEIPMESRDFDENLLQFRLLRTGGQLSHWKKSLIQWYGKDKMLVIFERFYKICSKDD